MPPSPLSVVRLVVSTDGEQYTVVDVTGAPDGAWIRQRIFAKLSVNEQTRGHFSIYPSEVGSYALGGALSDRRLHALCRESGDPSGSLKLFVSTSPDQPPSTDSALDTGFTRERRPVTIINGHFNNWFQGQGNNLPPPFALSSNPTHAILSNFETPLLILNLMQEHMQTGNQLILYHDVLEIFDDWIGLCHQQILHATFFWLSWWGALFIFWLWQPQDPSRDETHLFAV